MGCNSDYMEPTTKEKQLQLTAQLYVWTVAQMDSEPTQASREQAGNMYCNHDYTAALCGLLTSMSDFARDNFIYGQARDPMARKLADWWEEHSAADKTRLAKEAVEQRRRIVRQQALAKLNAEEREVFGITDEEL
jgi:hypothetical protein